MYPSIREFCRKFPVVLASGSPRRQALLTEIGCEFTVEQHDVDETRNSSEPPFDYAVRLAQEKAMALTVPAETKVFGFDTIVVIDNIVLGKPTSADDACRMLQLLSGKAHRVCTAIAIVGANKVLKSSFDLATVHFLPISDEQILRYVQAGEPMDKAGSYGIQGMGAFLVDTVEGNLDTVIGLPRNLLDEMCAAVLSQNR